MKVRATFTSEATVDWKEALQEILDNEDLSEVFAAVAVQIQNFDYDDAKLNKALERICKALERASEELELYE